MPPKPLERERYEIGAAALAEELLGKILVAPNGSGRIVETEAYGGKKDSASHGSKGMTPRNEVMFGPPGHLYVYFTYGMHFCANVVAGKDGECAAVLLRALAPIEGISRMYKARKKARQEKDLCSGPAKLTQALGINKSHNGADLTTGKGLYIYEEPDYVLPRHKRTGRIGISTAKDLKWRYLLPNDPNISRTNP